MNTIAIDKLDDVDNPDRDPVKVKIIRGSYGILMKMDGFSDRYSEDDGDVVLIENREGVPHVIIWGDINSEDPTQVISLAGANKNRRKNEV
tara:strand:+ start:2977 stop:3249 length:273 start_codon:yes stop_codon:yes gene_type:complete